MLSAIDRTLSTPPLVFSRVIVPVTTRSESVNAGLPGVTLIDHDALSVCASNKVRSVGVTDLLISHLYLRVKLGTAVFVTLTHGRLSVLNSSKVAPVA